MTATNEFAYDAERRVDGSGKPPDVDPPPTKKPKKKKQKRREERTAFKGPTVAGAKAASGDAAHQAGPA